MALPSMSQPIIGRFDAWSCLSNLTGTADESAAFQSDCGFGRTQGDNRIFTISNVHFPSMEQAISNVLAQQVRLSDPKVFVQTDGGGLELHCDPVSVVTWQIQSSKTWRIYDAALVPEDIRALRRAQATPLAAQLLSEFYGTLAARAAMEVTLTPGDFLVIDAYAPHETRAKGDGQSISMTLERCDDAVSQ